MALAAGLVRDAWGANPPSAFGRIAQGDYLAVQRQKAQPFHFEQDGVRPLAPLLTPAYRLLARFR